MKIHQLEDTILVRNKNYQLATDAEGGILYQEHFYPHVLSKTELREILNIIASGNYSSYIIKVNNGSILPPDDWSWVENFNLMRIYKAGITRVAYVSPNNIFSSLEMEKELRPGKIFRIRIFQKINDAILWLEKTAVLT